MEFTDNRSLWGLEGKEAEIQDHSVNSQVLCIHCMGNNAVCSAYSLKVGGAGGMVKPQCLEVLRGAGCSGVGDPFREGWKLEELGVGGMQGSCKSGWVSWSSKVVLQGERIARFHSS